MYTGNSGLGGSCPLKVCSDPPVPSLARLFWTKRTPPWKEPNTEPRECTAKNNPVFRIEDLWVAEELERHRVPFFAFLFLLPHLVELVPTGPVQDTGELQSQLIVPCQHL